MKLTADERNALDAARNVVSVHSPEALRVLRGLAARGLCEVSGPLQYQLLDPKTCPLGIAVITAEGRRALAHQGNNAHKPELEACHVG